MECERKSFASSFRVTNHGEAEERSSVNARLRMVRVGADREKKSLAGCVRAFVEKIARR